MKMIVHCFSNVYIEVLKEPVHDWVLHFVFTLGMCLKLLSCLKIGLLLIICFPNGNGCYLIIWCQFSVTIIPSILIRSPTPLAEISAPNYDIASIVFCTEDNHCWTSLLMAPVQILGWFAPKFSNLDSLLHKTCCMWLSLEIPLWVQKYNFMVFKLCPCLATGRCTEIGSKTSSARSLRLMTVQLTTVQLTLVGRASAQA